MIAFATAYKQLNAPERVFVDAFVAKLEADAVSRHENVGNALYRAIPASEIEASGGMLARPLVQAAVTERVSELARDQELTHYKVLKELSAIAFSNLQNYGEVDAYGLLQFDMKSATPEQMSAVKAIKVERSMKGEKIEIVLHDKMGALDRLAKYMGLLTDDNEHWKTARQRPEDPTLIEGVRQEDAAQAYARYLEKA